MLYVLIFIGAASLTVIMEGINRIARTNVFAVNSYEVIKRLAWDCLVCQGAFSLYRCCTYGWEGSQEQQWVAACKQIGLEWLQTAAWNLLYGYGYLAVKAQELGVWEAWDAVCDWSQRVIAPLIFGAQPEYEATYNNPKIPSMQVLQLFSDTAEDKERLRAWHRYNPDLCVATLTRLKTRDVLVGDNAAVALADWLASVETAGEQLLANRFRPLTTNPFLAIEIVYCNMSDADRIFEETRVEIDLSNVNGEGDNYLFAGNVIDCAVVQKWIGESLRVEPEYTMELLDNNMHAVTLCEADCVELLETVAEGGVGYRVLRGNKQVERKEEAEEAADAADAAAPSPEDWLECDATTSGTE